MKSSIKIKFSRKARQIWNSQEKLNWHEILKKIRHLIRLKVCKTNLTWFALTSTGFCSPLSVTRLQKTFQLFFSICQNIFYLFLSSWKIISTCSVKTFHHNLHLHLVYHQHQQRWWSLSGMLAMRGHRPILFLLLPLPPRPLPNQCSLCTHIRQHTLHTVFATVCTLHCAEARGEALSSWLLIKR